MKLWLLRFAEICEIIRKIDVVFVKTVYITAHRSKLLRLYMFVETVIIVETVVQVNGKPY